MAYYHPCSRTYKVEGFYAWAALVDFAWLLSNLFSSVLTKKTTLSEAIALRLLKETYGWIGWAGTGTGDIGVWRQETSLVSMDGPSFRSKLGG